MTKPKRARVQQTQQKPQSNASANQGHGAGKKHRKMSSFAKLSTKNSYNYSNTATANKENDAPARKGSSQNVNQQQNQNQTQKQKGQQKQQQNKRPIVPFRMGDRILLVGEGDFSFAHSLATHHRCKNLLATCYDSQETLYGKYPQAENHISEIIDAPTRRTRSKSKPPQPADTKSQKPGPKALFSVDAKKLGSAAGGGRDVRVGFLKAERAIPAWKKAKMDKEDGLKKKKKIQDNKDKDKGGGKGGPWDMICFNFPHVGGLSTDVNRQVRANQELLVAFFKACVPLLAGRPEVIDEDDEEDEEGEGRWGSDEGSEKDSGEDEDEDEKDNQNNDDHDHHSVKAKDERRTEPGQVLVTLFEGEPYTLWNIRDLARHAGLNVVTSFKFPWACYRGYSHARTLGEIEGKDGGRGGWRGEDREARMYVFEKKTDDNAAKASGKRKKRQADSDDSDSD
ncbi:25S rRNA (uracil2634-N3)-methyltransferase [Aspergillus stella-maris]|uniref:25S rRNA (uracil2634-N3)-methyltransferase n=1 Tax=Aspergillus stella-maris TaxID=1810926 RepID=UPI003CCC9145